MKTGETSLVFRPLTFRPLVDEYQQRTSCQPLCNREGNFVIQKHHPVPAQKQQSSGLLSGAFSNLVSRILQATTKTLSNWKEKMGIKIHQSEALQSLWTVL
jgi:hypothetical protein